MLRIARALVVIIAIGVVVLAPTWERVFLVMMIGAAILAVLEVIGLLLDEYMQHAAWKGMEGSRKWVRYLQ